METQDIVKNLREAFGFVSTGKKRYKPGSNRDMARTEEMRHLRFVERWSLQEIADKFGGLSRERVRQIIGNTGKGYKTERLNELASTHPELTNDEIESKFGAGLARRRRGQRHAVKGGSLVGKGTEAENKVSELLTEHGIPNKLMPYGHPFDILLDNGKRVDVKAAFCQMKPASQHYQFYNFHTGKGKDLGSHDHCDFYILVIYSTMDVFIVPSKEVKKSTRIIWPAAKKTKYEKYHNAFDLLSPLHDE